MAWVEHIGRLYPLNHQRLGVLDQPALFAECDRQLRAQVQAMARHRDEQLADPRLPITVKKTLKSWQNHWQGVTLFVDHPHPGGETQELLWLGEPLVRGSGRHAVYRAHDHDTLGDQSAPVAHGISQGLCGEWQSAPGRLDTTLTLGDEPDALGFSESTSGPLPSRTRALLSRLTCQRLDWRKPNGGLKDMACRVAMLRMQEDGLIELPPPRGPKPHCKRALTTHTEAQPPLTQPVHTPP